MDAPSSPYPSELTPEYVARLKRWHEAAYEDMRRRGVLQLSYLGLDLVVPSEVFAPTPTSDLLGNAVRAEVRPSDRVLDMGTGSGVNAILASATAREVVGVDINPEAVEAASKNAVRNGVESRTSFLRSDVFESVDGHFDLMIIDPPFRWFAARDLLEASMADENYAALTRFFAGAERHLKPDGRILVFFGTSGDMGYLDRLIREHGFQAKTVASRDLEKDGLTVTYRTQRLTR